MAEDIDALAAAAYAGGQDPVDVAVGRVATLIEARDAVLKGRQENPRSFPGFGPPDEEVVDAAGRSRKYSARFNQWLDSLSSEQRGRALEHYSEKGEFPPDLR